MIWLISSWTLGGSRLRIAETPVLHFLAMTKDKITAKDLNHIQQKIGGFGVKGRACLDGQLHRISAVYGRQRKLLGVTIRFGRQITNLAAKIHDVLFADPSKSILITGNPGTGKTSLIRDMVRFFRIMATGPVSLTPATKLPVMAMFRIIASEDLAVVSWWIVLMSRPTR